MGVADVRPVLPYRMLLRIALVAIGAGPGCVSKDAQTPDVEWVGDRLSFGAEPGTTALCGGSLEYMDGYLGSLEVLFAVDEDVNYQFFLLDRLDDFCPSSAQACANGTSIYSTLAPQEHELVHAVRSQFEGRASHPLLEEGAAEYWGDDSLSFPFRQDTGGDLLAVMRSDPLLLDDYGIAGRFSAFLDAEYGADTMNELSRATGHTTGFDELDAAMLAILGTSAEGIAKEFALEPECDHAVFRKPAHSCEQARKVVWCATGKNVHMEETVDCGDTETLGPRDGEIWKYVAVEIDQPGTYWLAVDGEENPEAAFIDVKACAGGCGSARVRARVATNDTGRSFELEAGRHILRLSRPEDQGGTFGFWLWRDGLFDSCE